MSSFKNKINKFLYRKMFFPSKLWVEFSNSYVKVFSHPRSGTHFLEAFIAANFYPNHLFEPREGRWGHWANRKSNPGTNIHYKIFGSHKFPDKMFNQIDFPSIYIFRDGRAVAYSIWKTENFIHPKHKGISFSDFLRLKLDWKGGPGNKVKPKMNIAQHWEGHVKGWMDIVQHNSNILLVSYEQLVDEPYQVYLAIHRRFFEKESVVNEKELIRINQPTGLKPNKAKKDSWKDVFSEDDLSYFNSFIQDQRLISYLGV